MKKKLDILRFADEKYVEEADPARAVRKKSRLTVLIAAVLSLTLLLGVLAATLLPAGRSKQPQVEGYLKIQSGIEDYLELYGTKNRNQGMAQNNGFWDAVAEFFGGGATKGENIDMDGADTYAAAEDIDRQEGLYFDKVEESAPPTLAGTPEEKTDDDSYSEVTDNQVEGVIEGDRFKRSDTHIFYLNANNVLKVYTIDGLDSKEVASMDVEISGKKVMLINGSSKAAVKEMFLSPDAKTLTLIVTYLLEDEMNLYVRVINYDVSNPEKISEKAYVDISGDYLSARYIDGKLLVMSSQSIKEKDLYNGNKLTFEDEADYLPQISDVSGELKTVSEDDIVIPDETARLCYTNVTVRDSETLESLGDKSFFSHSTDVYVTKNEIYLTSIYANMTEKDGGTVRDAMTDITCVTIGDGELTVKGTATVRGYVKDQYSMDERNGILRVVTTTNSTEMYSSPSEDNLDYGYGERFSIATATGRSSASLYCIDTQTFKTVAQVDDFAPPHEEVQSARFDGDTAYVCTSIEMSDPVFFFDLSDINNITYKETGTIEGYSTSLVNLKDGYLLGFGVVNWSDVKIEIYEETEDGVASVCSYTVPSAYISNEHKAHYIDREKNLLGFGVTSHETRKCEYILLGFTGSELVEIIRVEIGAEPDCTRATLIEEFFYILHTDGLTVKKLYE